jgi:hypothetical protein
MSQVAKEEPEVEVEPKPEAKTELEAAQVRGLNRTSGSELQFFWAIPRTLDSSNMSGFLL